MVQPPLSRRRRESTEAVGSSGNIQGQLVIHEGKLAVCVPIEEVTERFEAHQRGRWPRKLLLIATCRYDDARVQGSAHTGDSSRDGGPGSASLIPDTSWVIREGGECNGAIAGCDGELSPHSRRPVLSSVAFLTAIPKGLG